MGSLACGFSRPTHERLLLERRSVVSDRSHSPLEVVKFGEPPEIALIRCDHANTQSPCAHCDQRIIGQASLSNLLVIIFVSQARQHPPRQSPVAEIRHHYPSRSIEVPFQPLDDLLPAITGTSVEFLEHHGAQPYHRARV